MQLTGVCSKIVCALGPVFIIFGIISAVFWPDLFRNILGKEMVLAPNSKTYEIWKQPPIPLSLDIYFFNWTNHEDFTNHSTKPILVEVGPYRFREKPDKSKVKWHPENATVSYKRLSHFYFDEEGSVGTLNDTIITVNVVALSAAIKGPAAAMVSVVLSMYNQERHVIKTVDELLFTGYSDDLIDVARQMTMFSDVKVPFDRFGWFYTRNGSDDLTGFFNMNTGADDYRKVGELRTWNHEPRTEYFPGECGKVNGSGGEFYPPHRVRGESIGMFTADLCRTIPLDYKEDVTIRGITGYKYYGGPRSLDNGTLYPDNWCYCSGECVPSGVFNVSSCRYGTPVFMSYPHFYHADSYYHNMVEGLKPNQEKHEFSITLEPETGIPLEVKARFQVNLRLKPMPSISLYEDVPYIFFPVIWFEQTVTIDSAMAADLKMALKMPLIGQISACVIALVGVLMIVSVALNHYIRSRRVKEAMDKNRPPNGIENKNDWIPEGSPLLHKNSILKNIELKKINNKSDIKA